MEKGIIGFSILAVGYVSISSMIDPVSTMELVNVSLTTNDAISSIRGVYGGVGLLVTVGMVYLITTNIHLGLIFTTMFWGSYALSRLITIISNGPLGNFGSQWIIIESGLFFIGLSLLLVDRKFGKS
jgi:hypothetical protein